MFRRLILGISLFTTASCSRAAGFPEPTSQPLPKEIPEPPHATQGTWRFAQDPRPASYTTISTTILELQLDTVTQRDTIRVTASYTIAATGHPDSTKLTGSLEQISVETGGHIGQSADSTPLPMNYTGRVARGILILDSAGKTALQTSRVCTGNSLSIFPVIQRNLLTLPQMITAGMTWSDSVSLIDCSGSVPVALKAFREYKTIGETTHRGRRLILIERSDKTTGTGEGAQGQHRLTLRTDGTGLVRLYLDRTSGRLEAAEGEKRSRVAVTASGRTRLFQQTTREETTRTGTSN